MPSVTLKVATQDGRQASIELETTDAMESLYVLIEAQFSIPIARQRLVALGRALGPTGTLQDQGLTHNCVVHVTDAPPKPADPPASSSGNVDDRVKALFGPAPPTAAAPAKQPSANQSIDEKVAALFSNPPKPARSPQHQPIDPNSEEYQRMMYERIQEEQRQQNLEQALEYTPEAFGRVVMLYVPAVVNKTKLTAFIDSGAQMTVMSLRVAEQCGITRLIDKRFGGVAKGVGTSKIIGKVHMSMVTVGGIVMPMSITVLEQDGMDFLIGLDQLKRHQMSIDLKDNVLRFEGAAVPFLAEHELPPHIRGESEGTDVPPPPTGVTHSAPSSASAGGRRLGGEGDDDNDRPPAPTPTPQAGAVSSSSTTAPPPTAALPPPASGSGGESPVDILMQATGASKEVAQEALNAAGGNVDAAITFLLGE